jgi:hypothetical protein
MKMKMIASAWRRLALGIAGATIWTVATTAAMASPPECLPTEAIDCSTTWLNLFRPIAVAAIVFESACVTHDLCYRHGAATYGYDKMKCDEDLLADIDTMCRSDIRFIDVATLGLTRVFCNIGKRGFYAAVSRSHLADEAFKTDESTCCRYDEDGIPLPQCAL